MLRWKHWNIYTEKASIPMALSAEFLLSFTEVNVHQSIVTLQNKPFLFFTLVKGLDAFISFLLPSPPLVKLCKMFYSAA